MPTWLTLKASLYAGLALLVLLAVQTARLSFAQAAVKSAKADVAVVKAELSVRTFERDTAADRAKDQARAADSWKLVAEEREKLLTEAQAENTRLREDNAAAIAAAAAKQRAAAADLRAWRAKYAALLQSDDCTRAQLALEAACTVDSY